MWRGLQSILQSKKVQNCNKIDENITRNFVKKATDVKLWLYIIRDSYLYLAEGTGGTINETSRLCETGGLTPS